MGGAAYDSNDYYSDMDYDSMLRYQRMSDGNEHPNDHFRGYITPFWNCKSLQKITLGSDVTYFSLKYFPNSTLTSIILNNNDNFVVDGNILYDKTQTKIIAYFNTQNNPVFSLPENVESISPFALAYSSYESITLPKRINIIDGIFAFCHKLKTVEIQAKITRLGDATFFHCYNLETITFKSESVITSIGHDCFICCYKLSTLPSMNNVESLGNHSFAYCQALTTINLPKVNNYPAFCFWKSSIQQITPSTSLFIIEESVFNSSEITSFDCPSSLTYIGLGAFENCMKLTTFNYNDKINAILFNTFCNTSLSSIKIKNIISYIHPTAFKGSFKINFVFEEGGHPLFMIDNNCFIEKRTGVLLFTFGKIFGKFKISDKVNRANLKSLFNERVVKYNKYVIKQGISTLIIPESVKDSYDFTQTMSLEEDRFESLIDLDNICFEGKVVNELLPQQTRAYSSYRKFFTEKLIKKQYEYYDGFQLGCSEETISGVKPNVYEAANGEYPTTYKLDKNLFVVELKRMLTIICYFNSFVRYFINELINYIAILAFISIVFRSRTPTKV
ncbi:surface antigen BspA-like [Trichomonas vaginalis G3]|uniref:Surface antigen BspA-like n=1 Tax=Trichomonas vaginalis (strain ATCC PRA-98 / G3) TaxID=412133 RepID=A2DZY0_TRIV3|nr:ribonuclease inhibitor domain-containing protein [Trichomonas vaginalis G3]EAY14039.1 surface antigen BspA-like [Trichomonas vaginalis G3]KAI5519522.1 ribonuclease inhibitor domain-containing protein [Trichomonas vaginalis G3]|eukprot:XP_001326262.1 surface antigen BspA-like [Trichomonas vaginalis G3]